MGLKPNQHIDLNDVAHLKFAENIKRVRALVTKNTIAEYFDNLRTTLEGVEPSNVVNYDETNFSDNPEYQNFCKRGVRHADRIMDTSKTSISVMVAEQQMALFYRLIHFIRQSIFMLGGLKVV
ncbi:hypothetical protein NQ315_006687 [Exocentrus adspersus]|uniref:Transposase n=1 Tax=Exocentrus adspersus TaxID=1586481 RepID=A0AAV8WBF1_9CUCU|nr:hypothetical protein NQ315_006687 [Exocentrus adspersus]